MPQIIVAADRGAAFGEGAVTLRETVSVADFESQHFAAQLVERLGWAVEDADRVEEDSPSAEERANRVEEDSPSADERAKARAPQHIPDQRRARRISEGPQSQREERVTVQSPA
jgi:hypothetical protein